MKNIKAYKWLAVTFLLSVSVFCYLYLTKLPSKTSPVSGEKTVSSASDTERDKPEEQPVSYNELPRPAYEENDFIVQNTGGTGDDVLKNVHTLNGYSYLFFDTNSNGSDVRTERPSVAVAMTDANAQLIKTSAFTSGSSESYLHSKIIADGFALLTGSSGYSALYKINRDLVNTAKIVFDCVSDGKTYLCDSGNLAVMLFSESAFTIKLVSPDFVVIKSSSVYLSKPESVNVFPRGDLLDVFINSDKGYSRLTYSEKAGFISEESVPDKKLVDIMPVTGGFAGVEKDGATQSIFVSDYRFEKTAQKEIPLSDFSVLLPGDNNFTLISGKDGKTSSSVYCLHLDEMFANEQETGINAIINRVGEYLITYFDGKIGVVSFNAQKMKTVATFSATNSFATLTRDGYLCFSSNRKGGIYKNGFGSTDVYAVKISELATV